LLEDLTWQEAEKSLKAGTVVAIPLGATAKEHGPHLKLKNDWTMAEYYKRRAWHSTARVSKRLTLQDAACLRARYYTGVFTPFRLSLDTFCK